MYCQTTSFTIYSTKHKLKTKTKLVNTHNEVNISKFLPMVCNCVILRFLSLLLCVFGTYCIYTEKAPLKADTDKSGFANSTRLLLFTSAPGCRASEKF